MFLQFVCGQKNLGKASIDFRVLKFHIPWFSSSSWCPTCVSFKQNIHFWPEVWIQTRRASKEDQYPPRCLDEFGEGSETQVETAISKTWCIGYALRSLASCLNHPHVHFRYLIYLIGTYTYIFIFTELHICSHLHRILLLLKVPLYRCKFSSMIRSAPADVYVLDTMCTYVQSLLCAVTPVSIPRCHPGTETGWTQGSTL